MTSFFPRLLPAGAAALPKPLAVMTSTSMVSSPRLLKTLRAMRSSMIDDKRKFPLGALYLLARGYFRFRQRTMCWWLVGFLFSFWFWGSAGCSC